MMKKKSIIAMLLAVTGIVACQREALQEVEVEAPIPVPVKRMNVNASWGSDATRTSISPDDVARKYVFQWEAGDAINLVEADPSVTGDEIRNSESAPLEESSKVARFSMLMDDREAGSQLYYTAYYPVSALSEGKSASWANGAISLPLVLPTTQHPGTDSFDGNADLLVSLQKEQEKRPEELELEFKRIGTVLKLVVTGLPAETSVLGGTLNLGYDSVGEILYNADTRKATPVDLQKSISFEYNQPLAVQGGSATIWLRVFSGVADGQVSLVLNAATAGDPVTYTRNINLMQRRASIEFKEGGVTTFSVAFDPNSVIQLIDQTSVPKLYINTQGGVAITSKTEWTQTKVKIEGDNDAVILDLTEDFTGAQIKGRGNTTWTYPKKPYYLKFSEKRSLFGTSVGSKKYILLANWMDRTNLRNAVAFEAARLTRMEWAPKGMFVVLYLNDNLQGLYYLCEKIEAEDGRLNLKKKNGDFLYTFDTSDPNEKHFEIVYGYRPQSRITGLPVEIKYPDPDDYDTKPDDWAQLKSDAAASFTDLDTAIKSENIASTVNLASFCDWYLVHELCVNEEPKHPKSCYMYRKSGVFYAGPVWDFDWGTFIPTDETGLLPTINNSLFYGKPDKYTGLFQNPEFVRVLKERWEDLMPKFKTLGNFIDVQAAWIETAEAANHEMWPIKRIKDPVSGQYLYSNDAVTANGDQNLSFQAAVNRMKAAIAERIDEIDDAIDALQ